MSGRYDDYYFDLPEPVREKWYHEVIDYENDGTVWRPIKGFQGYYISRYGEVLSMRTGKPVYLKPFTGRDGYQYVDFSYGGVRNRRAIHRLVADNFIPHNGDLTVVMHLDDNKSNNEAANLRWGTTSENNRDAVKHGLNYHKSVYCFEEDRIFQSCAEAARYFGVSNSLVSSCCLGKRNTILGCYHVCFEEDRLQKEENNEWLRDYGRPKPVKAENVLTGEIIFFRSRASASAYLGIPETSLRRNLDRSISNVRGWIFTNCSYKEGDGKWTHL